MRAMLALLIAASVLSACTDEHEQLMRELEDVSPVIRAGAVKSLAKLGDDEAYTLVSRSLQDPSAVVRIAAVQAMGDFKERDTSAAIVRASLDRDAEVREVAVGMLRKLAGDRARDALVKMLLRGEPDPKVRQAAYAALEEKGLSGQRLAGEMAESQMTRARERLAKGNPAERLQIVQMAGRLVHPEGIDLVIEGLADSDQDVVIAALGVLDGRGGQPALQRLQLLLSDQVKEIRLAAARALAGYGPAGQKLLEVALRDREPGVRQAALDAFGASAPAPAPEALCERLTDPDAAVALRAAGLMRGREHGCSLAALDAQLAGQDAAGVGRAVAVLGALGGQPAIDRLEAKLKAAPKAERLPILAALARAGQRRPGLARELQAAFQGALDEIARLDQRWVTGKLPPTGAVPVQPDEASEGRLSEAELNALRKKHGLGPADKNSPRGVGDILAGFDEAHSKDARARLFEPIGADLVDRVSMGLDGLLFLDPGRAGPLVGQVLGIASVDVVARVARLLAAHAVRVDFDDAQLANLERVLEAADPDQTEALTSWLSGLADDRLVGLMTGCLKAASWEKRLPLIEALGELGKPAAVGALGQMLQGYSSIPAARALGQIGDPKAIPALEAAMGQAGPAEEIEVMMALAKLGSRAPVEVLLKRLNAPEADVRRAAVRILGVMGGREELDALRGLRYDLDRLVRDEVRRVLERGTSGDETDGSAKEANQGSSGQPAQGR